MIRVLSHVSRDHTRDFDVADTTLLDPYDADAFEAGEWAYIDTNGRLARIGADAEEVPNAYQVFTPKGSTDAQSLGKMAVLFSRDYEVETDMFDSGDTFAIGDQVGLTLATVDGATRMVFTNTLTTNTDYFYGEVTLDPDNNNDLLRVHVFAPHLKAA